MIPTHELNESLRKAREATSGDWLFNARIPFSVRCIEEGLECALVSTHRKQDARHIAHMNPEFTLRLLKEFLWQREIIERMKPYLLGQDHDERWNSLLSDLETGPTDNATGQEK